MEKLSDRIEKLSDRWMCYGGMLAIAGADIDDLKHIQNLIDAEEQGNLVEVVHGKWIRTHNGDGWNDWYDLECPVCGEYYKKPNFKENFCPNCGAKMDGAE